jgi:hypothetical protein
MLTLSTANGCRGNQPVVECRLEQLGRLAWPLSQLGLLPCCADALNNAISCTILAAAGPQRSRMLAQLYKDERSAKLSVFPFLEKVYLERILRK